MGIGKELNNTLITHSSIDKSINIELLSLQFPLQKRVIIYSLGATSFSPLTSYIITMHFIIIQNTLEKLHFPISMN